jgi:MraZ protein
MEKIFIIPKVLQETLGNKVVVTRGIDSCLLLYSVKVWKQIKKEFARKIVAKESSSNVKAFLRLTLAGAEKFNIKNGEISFPDYLLEFAHLEDKKTAIILQLQNGFEIWNKGLFLEHIKNYKGKQLQNGSRQLTRSQGKVYNLMLQY